MIVVAIIVVAVVLAVTLAIGLYFFLAKGAGSVPVGILVFGAIGVSLIGLSSVMAWDRYRFIQRSDSAVGEVVGIDESYNTSNSGGTQPTYTPRVRFKTAQGRVIEFFGPSSQYRDYKESERVELRYLPEEPEKPKLKGLDALWLAVAILLFIGVGFTGIALRVAVDSFRNRKTKIAKT